MDCCLSSRHEVHFRFTSAAVVAAALLAAAAVQTSASPGLASAHPLASDDLFRYLPLLSSYHLILTTLHSSMQNHFAMYNFALILRKTTKGGARIIKGRPFRSRLRLFCEKQTTKSATRGEP